MLRATPQEFESPILRRVDLQEHPMMTAGMRPARVEKVSFSGLNFERPSGGYTGFAATILPGYEHRERP
jgi:hypothetical protein